MYIYKENKPRPHGGQVFQWIRIISTILVESQPWNLWEKLVSAFVQEDFKFFSIYMYTYKETRPTPEWQPYFSMHQNNLKDHSRTFVPNYFLILLRIF